MGEFDAPVQVEVLMARKPHLVSVSVANQVVRVRQTVQLDRVVPTPSVITRTVTERIRVMTTGRYEAAGDDDGERVGVVETVRTQMTAGLAQTLTEQISVGSGGGYRLIGRIHVTQTVQAEVVSAPAATITRTVTDRIRVTSGGQYQLTGDDETECVRVQDGDLAHNQDVEALRVDEGLMVETVP